MRHSKRSHMFAAMSAGAIGLEERGLLTLLGSSKFKAPLLVIIDGGKGLHRVVLGMLAQCGPSALHGTQAP